ncbi:transcriptional regulator FilR1 domain-containing protein [Salinibaculum salinum]|uniref:helix-turn-helix transcriptional regulator n=1 Tax=Salinibaculum salinum TaxID=3131996 RepID=UPI0030EC6FF8
MTDADPLEEIEFLARSANRIEVLAALVEEPQTRQSLADSVGVSQPTLGRILRDLTKRKWVRADGDQYRVTATGELVATGITDLRERLATETKLRDVIEWIPTDTVDVGLHHFADARITTPSQTRPNAPIKRMLELLSETDHALLLSHAFNEQKLQLIRDRSVEGKLTTRGVFAEDAIEAIEATADLRELLADIVASEAAEIRVVSTDIPVAIEVTDSRTHLLLRNDEGIVRASLDTDDETVRAWAERLHEKYWSIGTPLSVDDIGD